MTTTLDLHRLRRAASMSLPADHFAHNAIRRAISDPAAERYLHQLFGALMFNDPRAWARTMARYAMLAGDDMVAVMTETAGQA